jgi:glutathione S-transferase
MERYLNRELGPHVRRWVYSHILGCPGLLNRLSSTGVPRAERLLTSPIMYVTRPLIRRGYRVGPDTAERSLQRVHEVFQAIGERLADGRGYLVAGELSVADITFAALAAPLLLPERYGGALPSQEELPDAMRSECLRLRSTRAGAYAVELYERHRAGMTGLRA